MQPYRTPLGVSSAEVEEKKSRFIAQLAHAQTEEEAVAFLQQVRAANRTARHNVYAYALREDNRQRYSDDGEPAKTAGLPVLECLQHAQLTDAVLVVTRYFGGVLLGTGGLVRCYTAAAQGAVAAAKIAAMQPCVRFCFTVEYPLAQQAQNICAEAGAQQLQTEYGAAVTLRGVILHSLSAALEPPLQALCRGKLRLELSQPFFAPLA